MKDDYLIVDIGSKTTDVVYHHKGLLVESKSITIERAMVKWICQIQGSLQVQYGKNIPESEILKVILKQTSKSDVKETGGGMMADKYVGEPILALLKLCLKAY